MIAKKANDKLASKSRSRKVTEDLSTERVVSIIRENAEVFRTSLLQQIPHSNSDLESLIEHFATSNSPVLNLHLPNISIYPNQNTSRRAVITDPASLPMSELEMEDGDDADYRPPSQQQQHRRARRNAAILDPEIMNIFWQSFNNNTLGAQQDPFAEQQSYVELNDGHSSVGGVRNRHRVAVNQNIYHRRVAEGTATITGSPSISTTTR